MPRVNRIDIANGVHHVTQRGLERRNIVLNDDDRSHWWRLFDRVATRCQWRVFAVALLNNHFHIYLRTPEPNLSEGMRDLDSGYASFFNQRHEREGPLFQGRFKSVFVENEGHSWELSRYVHLNPYRAKLVSNPIQYQWCSYRYYLGGSTSPDWLDWRTVLAEFAGTEAAARVAYKRFVEAGMGEPPTNPILSLPPSVSSENWEVEWPNNDLLDLIPRQSKTFDNVIEVVCIVFETTTDALSARGRHDHVARDAAVLLCREFLSADLAEVSQRFGDVSRSSISEIVKRARIRADSDVGFRNRLEAVRSRLR